MKNQLYLFFIIIMSLSASVQSQTIQSLSILPANPGTSDVIKLVVNTQFSSGSCWLMSENHFISGNTITVSASYQTGIAAVICDRSDTFSIANSLPCGTYTVNVQTTVYSAFPVTDNSAIGFVVSCGTPGNPFTSAITSKNALLNWTTTCALGYQVQYRKVGDAGWKTVNVSTNIGVLKISGLKRGKIYEWKVKAKCSANPTVYSDFTALQTFTANNPLRFDEDQEEKMAMENEEKAGFTIFPNPSGQDFNIKFLNDFEECAIQVFTILGENIFTEHLNKVVEGDSKHIHLDQVKNGVYYLKVSSGSGVYTEKLIVQ